MNSVGINKNNIWLKSCYLGVKRNSGFGICLTIIPAVKFNPYEGKTKISIKQ